MSNRPTMDATAWKFAGMLAVLAAVYVWANLNAHMDAPSSAAMVERVTLGEGPCEVTVHPNSLPLLYEMGLQEWLERCSGETEGGS